jgi:hypothetical protein
MPCFRRLAGAGGSEPRRYALSGAQTHWRTIEYVPGAAVQSAAFFFLPMLSPAVGRISIAFVIKGRIMLHKKRYQPAKYVQAIA